MARIGLNTVLPGTGSIGGPALGAVTSYLEKYLLKYIPRGFNDNVSAAFLNMARSGKTQGADQVLSTAMNLSKGDQIIGKSVKALFNQAPREYLDVLAEERKRDKVKEALNDSSQVIPSPTPNPSPLGFAQGGEVPIQNSDPVSDMYPELGMTMGTIKGRVSNYLRSLKPDEQKTRLPYDLNEKNPQHEHEYNKAIDLAIKPLSILKKIKNGSITPKHINHFTSLYPELHQDLSQRINEQIAEERLKNNPKPNYGMRQALSLFLGSNLDSSLSQPVLALAQSAFIPKQPPQGQPAPKQVKSKSSLSKVGQSALTGAQAREQRDQKI